MVPFDTKEPKSAAKPTHHHVAQVPDCESETHTNQLDDVGAHQVAAHPNGPSEGCPGLKLGHLQPRRAAQHCPSDQSDCEDAYRHHRREENTISRVDASATTLKRFSKIYVTPRHPILPAFDRQVVDAEANLPAVAAHSEKFRRITGVAEDRAPAMRQQLKPKTLSRHEAMRTLISLVHVGTAVLQVLISNNDQAQIPGHLGPQP